MRIRIEKIGEVPSGLPSNPKGAHIDGQIQNENFSLPIEYTIEGNLIGEMEIGEPVTVARDTRNGVKVTGIFTTSPVQEIKGHTFKTRNSVYNFKFLKK